MSRYNFYSQIVESSYLVHPEIHEDPPIGVRLRAAYDTAMAAMVVAGIVS